MMVLKIFNWKMSYSKYASRSLFEFFSLKRIFSDNCINLLQTKSSIGGVSTNQNKWIISNRQIRYSNLKCLILFQSKLREFSHYSFLAVQLSGLLLNYFQLSQMIDCLEYKAQMINVILDFLFSFFSTTK